MAVTTFSSDPVFISELACARRGGPLVAVAGICGGAGASTLTFLLAYAAAQASGNSSGAPVLCCDTGGPTSGLALYAGAAAPRSLPGLADHLAAGGALTETPFVEGPAGMRLLAGAPLFTGFGDSDMIRKILADARAAHGMTVVDCGTLQRPADQIALSQATHVLWMAPATDSGVRRAARTFAVAPPLAAQEIVVARCEHSERTAPMRALTALAETRGTQLLLLPHIPDLLDGTPDEAVAVAQVALQALAGILR